MQQNSCRTLRFQPTCGAANPFPVSWGNDLARIYEARPRHVLRRCGRGRFLRVRHGPISYGRTNIAIL